MCYHEWGDDWPYWNELYKAEQYIVKMVYRLSLCRLSSKEKYGTIRYEFLTTPVNYDNILYCYWRRYGEWVLKGVVRRASKKFPNVSAEILDDAEYI